MTQGSLFSLFPFQHHVVSGFTVSPLHRFGIKSPKTRKNVERKEPFSNLKYFVKPRWFLLIFAFFVRFCRLIAKFVKIWAKFAGYSELGVVSRLVKIKCDLIFGLKSIQFCGKLFIVSIFLTSRDLIFPDVSHHCERYVQRLRFCQRSVSRNLYSSSIGPPRGGDRSVKMTRKIEKCILKINKHTQKIKWF